MDPRGVEQQPVSAVEWVDPATLRANAWNPNRQAPPESRLLKLSLMEDGWTSPIVAGTDDEIIDGFHRWTLGLQNQDVRSMTGGLIPIVRVDITPEHRRLSTVRHNRARGTHHVLGMADIVAELLEMGLSADEISRRLQMDDEEVDRLADRGQMTKRGAAAGFGNGWTV
jgi:ParB-like chromosome segregation protein Spo0J